MASIVGGETLALAALLAAALLSSLPPRQAGRLPSALILVALGLGAYLVGGPGAKEAALFIVPLAALGLAYSLFVVGSSIGLPRILGLGSRGLAFGLIAWASSLLIGWAFGSFVLGLASLDALLIGAAFSASGSLGRREYQGLEELDAQAAPSIVGMNDLGEILRFATIFVLVILRGLRSARSASLPQGFLPWLIVTAVALVLFIGWLVALWFRKEDRTGPEGTGALLVAGFGAALLASASGLSPALGAAAAGVAVGRFAAEGSPPYERFRFAGRAFFLPLVCLAAGLALFPLQREPEALPLHLTLLLGLALLVLPRLFALPALLSTGGRAAPLSLLGLAFAPGRDASTLLWVLFVGGSGGLGRGLPGLLAATLPLLWLFELLAGAAFGKATNRPEPRIRTARPGSGSTGLGEILVGLANPGTAAGLLSLAFAIRGRTPAPPVRPLVICEEEDSERELERAEYLLTQAMVASRDAGQQISPATERAPSVAEGLARVAAELGDPTLILGWHRRARPFSPLAAGVVEATLALTEALVVVVRPASGFRGIERLVLALPPGSGPGLEARPTLPFISALVGALLPGLGSRILVLAQDREAAAARRLSARLRFRGSTEIMEVPSWKQFAKAAAPAPLAAAARRSCYAVLSGRPGSPGWHPSFENLPREFAEAFADSPLLVIHPPAEAEGGGEEEEGQGIFAVAESKGRVLVGMEETAVTDALRRLLATTWGKESGLARLTALFTGIAQKEAIELEPGVVLLHAHVPGIEAPLVFFGSRPEGWRLLALAEPVRVLVVLCAPEGQAPERHLATLGELARLFKDGRLARRLAAPRDPA